MGCEFFRMGIDNPLEGLKVLDTCTEKTAELCQIPGGRGGRFKLPQLTELHQFLFGAAFAEAHNATADVEATTRCFFELIRKEHYSIEELDAEQAYLKLFKEANPYPIKPVGLKHLNLKEASAALLEKASGDAKGKISAADKALLEQARFAHLHNHSQFSILQSTMTINNLVSLTAKQGMTAVALTDQGNMMGAFHFVKAIGNHNKGARAKNKELESEGKEEATEKEILRNCWCRIFRLRKPSR